MDKEYLTTDLAELRPYATFRSQQTMDETIYAHIEHLRSNEVPESVIDVLLFFGRSSLRVLGVSFAKYDTIAESIGKSKSTVIRAVKTLKQYGMIDVIPTLKKWGCYGHSRKKSVNVIRVLNVSMTPQADTAEATANANEGTLSDTVITTEPIILKQQELLHKTSQPYTRFKSLISDKKLRNKIYGIWLAHTSYIRDYYDQDTLVDIGIQAIMITFKSRKARSKTSYYNGVLDRLLDRLHYATIADAR
ncbi:helix-turn-helix domain-containing protein [Mesobacillus subterraneus]|uniref:helix-turn-helix domain-containing protein n=1 Tax=Mesobacillus subterraneus TaxID=285983 RepID=UPI002040E7F6|nr:helix-turn-helix domain-containing protein [Mesobacillus subterraneus]MCM3572526.1 helix-turn-helix domain-containing protein [Mesobacillus subterraneus]